MKINNGFTKIPNFLLETILNYGCTGKQKELLFAVIRLTYGYHRDSAEIALSLLERMVNQDKATISKNINSLISKNVLIVEASASFNSPRIISINLNINAWEGVSLNSGELEETERVEGKSIQGVEKKSTITVDETSNMKETFKEINNNGNNLNSLMFKNIITKLFKYYCGKNPHPAEIAKIEKEVPENFQESEKVYPILVEAFQEFPSLEHNKQNTRYLAGVVRKKINNYLTEINKSKKRQEKQKTKNQSKNGSVKLNLLEQYDYLRKTKQIIN